MRNAFLMMVPLVGIFAGCTSNSGIMPIGRDTYMVSTQSHTYLTNAATLQMEAFQEATQFCKEQRKSILVTYTTEVDQPYIDQRIQSIRKQIKKNPHLGYFPNAEIQFMCLNESIVELQRQKSQNIPYQTIEIEKGEENTGQSIWVMQLKEVNELLMLQRKNTNDLQDSLLSPKQNSTYIKTKY
jgi:hypothetical protein